ncbi:MAG: LuxR C-terminal-related transcriptional regulator [Firmicutes bacterium]|nr:LuxR C-terminal-related transcriptional regulator [Bacillota bacterium]
MKIILLDDHKIFGESFSFLAGGYEIVEKCKYVNSTDELYNELAKDMGISERTVFSHLNSIYSKLGASNAVEAMIRLQGLDMWILYKNRRKMLFEI